MKKILIFGNSGAGKSTLAKTLAQQDNIPHLDLDTLAWQPAQPGIRRPLPETLALLEAFISTHPAWVIEGCYGSLLDIAAQSCTQMRFLNPGIEVCLRHNAQRPWEPHKYSSPAAQDKNLEMLRAWVAEYETRDDEYSLAAHRGIFDRFSGDKKEYR